MDDQTALEDIRKNGKKGIGCIILYKRYVDDISDHIRDIYNIPENDVAYLVEEVFVKFYNKKAFKRGCEISSLLNPIIQKVVKTYSEKRSKDKDSVSDVQFDEPPTSQEIKYDDQICLEQIRERLEREDTELANCFEAMLLFYKYEKTIKDISEEIGRNLDATKTYLSYCKKRLAKYPPLQECRGIFLKICLESVKANLERDGFNDPELIACLEVCILRLQGKSIQEIAFKRWATVRETQCYISECIEKLRQHPMIPEECREWLQYLK